MAVLTAPIRYRTLAVSMQMVLGQLPETVRSRWAVDLRSDVAGLRTVARFVRTDGWTLNVALDPMQIDGETYRLKIPDWAVAQLTLVS